MSAWLFLHGFTGGLLLILGVAWAWAVPITELRAPAIDRQVAVDRKVAVARKCRIGYCAEAPPQVEPVGISLPLWAPQDHALQPTPEPATLLLLGGTLLAAGWAARRRR